MEGNINSRLVYPEDNLYNARSTWLDQAVFAAYGWYPDLSDEEILEKLLSLNLEMANKQSA